MTIRPRLKPTIEPFPAPDGDVYLLRDFADDLVIRSPDAAARALLDRLDGSLAVHELAPALRAGGHAVDAAAVEATLAQLRAAGVVEDAAQDDELDPVVRARFDRQLRYFGDAAGARAPVQRRLSEASVLLLGAGGLGCWTAYALACAGIGRLVVVDGDAVELSNLNRQILYSEGDVGRPKARVAARRLRAFSSCTEIDAIDARVDGPAAVERLVAGHDLVLDLADMPVGDLQRWVDGACFAAGIPYAVAGQFPPLVRVGPLFVPGRTGCFACEEAAWRARHPLYDAVDRWRRDRPSSAATFGPACGLIGSMLANDVVNHLTGIAPAATLGRALLVDMNTLERRDEPVPRRPGCPRCGGGDRRSG
ncbi:MAG TPA: TOMM precursor leader peptide-binding protein [Solirubrobacteraceae bacterium]|jgi:bacteriocin biosynthesis cyclodehydratase domain-containing protein|nr:TOMM precursor leader peptide-binding protein [Solirubrobacteraceae bacterium]